MFARAGSNKDTEPPARILVVEDDFVVAAGIERALFDARFDVAGVAASADEAVELAESQKPSLIVMDVRLAGERDGRNPGCWGDFPEARDPVHLCYGTLRSAFDRAR
jgi:hypothetical protein